MNLIIIINQPGHKPRRIETKLSDHTSMTTLRKLWETEQFLNGELPGSDLRFHINIEERK